MPTTTAPSGTDSQACVPTQQLRTQAYWVNEAAKQRAASEVLLVQYLSATDLTLERALWDGACALIGRANSLEKEAIEHGALLHVGVPAAIHAAKAIDEARWNSALAKVCA